MEYKQSEQNPCVRCCCLDDEDVCQGCFRTLDEILAWRSYSEQQRLEALARCSEREAIWRSQHHCFALQTNSPRAG